MFEYIRKKFHSPLSTVAGGIICIIIGTWLWSSLAGSPLDELALIRNAHITKGFIVDTWEDVESGDRRVQWYHGAEYTFRLPGGREITSGYSNASGRLKDKFRDLQKPYPVEVEYLPKNPQISRLKGRGAQTIAGWLWRKLISLGFFNMIGIYIITMGVMEYKALRNSSAFENFD